MGMNQDIMIKRDAIFEKFAPGFLAAKEELRIVKGYGKKWDAAFAKYGAFFDQAWEKINKLTPEEWEALNA
ncbi:MAG TPA: hypothetical protein VLH56_19325 [Dissulfurispiraceae bacterium]|nr:hypothetical protein [Dissulfurispiraceae bacterium]